MYEYKAAYISNYDGDTVRLRVDLGFYVFVDVVARLARVDAPEMRGGTVSSRMFAKAARDFVAQQLAGQELLIKSAMDKTATDLYGRWIVEITQPDGTNLSDLLVQKGLAKAKGF
jgi:endonuclease YncB( thermonuclease family)